MNVVAIEYVDYGAQGEYGFFGKVVARSIVESMSRAEIDKEKAEMVEILGATVQAVEIESI